MRRAHKDDSRCVSSNTAETRLVRLQRDEEGLFRNQTAETARNKEDGTFDLVQSAVGDSICKGLSMSAEAFSASVLPDAYHVGVVAVSNDLRGRKPGTHEAWYKGAVWMRAC